MIECKVGDNEFDILEVKHEEGNYQLIVEQISELNGGEDELILTIKRQPDEKTIEHIFNLMMTDDTHKNGVDFKILHGDDDFFYNGYNILALSIDSGGPSNEKILTRITFRNETARKD